MGTGMLIDGVAASEAIDSSGEILDVEGCDISELEEGRGVLNWEHRGEEAPGASPNDIVGKIVYAKKIFSESDCETDRQRMYWKKVNLPFVYIVGRLFDGAGHPGATALAAIIRDYKANNEPVLARYSIEGSTLDKKGNRLVESVARRVAVTIKPCNRTCNSDVLEDPNAPEGFETKHIKSKDKDVLDFEEVSKSEHPHPLFTPLGGSFAFEGDPELPELDKAEPDEYLYHVTLARHLPGIAARGLLPDAGRGIGSVAYDGNRGGHVFLTEKAGVGHWHDAAANHAFDQHDDVVAAKAVPIVLRVPKSALKQVRPDVVANKETIHAHAHKVGHAIPSQHLQVWNGTSWGQVSEHESVPHHLGVDGEGYLLGHQNPLLPKFDSPLGKTLTAGVPSAAPGSLTGGAALQREEIGSKRNQLLAALRDYDRPFDKTEFRSFVKNRLPEASEEFLDHFVGMAEDYHVRRQQLRKKEEAPGAEPASPPPNRQKITVNEDDANAVVKIPFGTIRGVKCLPNKKLRGPVFDEENGILHTPKGSFPLYNPDNGFAVVEHKAARKPFYKNGVLHVAPGTAPEQMPPHNPPNPKFREIYTSKAIEEFHSGKVMPNWARVHELVKARKLPEEVVMHSAIFSMLSPNTPVRPHELMYAHMADTFEDIGIDPRDPDFRRARRHWLGKDQPRNYPNIGREYFQAHPDVHLSTDSKEKSRKEGDLMSFMLGENKFKNIAQYHQLHSTLMDMVRRHGTDARAATAELMAHKHKHMLWQNGRRIFKNKVKQKAAEELGLRDERSTYIESKMREAAARSLIDDRNKTQYRKQLTAEADKLGLKDHLSDYSENVVNDKYGDYSGVIVPGLAPKTGRFTFSMIGGGNSFVPDTHITRHLFGMDANKDSDTLAYVKSVVWNAKNHHVLEGIDRWYSKNHPAAQLMQSHPQWGYLFKEDPEQAVFPAFWRHWCSIAEDERSRGMQNTAANEFSTHEPFWLGIKPHLDKLLKGETNERFHAKLIALHKQYETDHGEVPAQMLFYAHVVPHLLEAAKFRVEHDSTHDLLKAVRAHALDVELRKTLATATTSELGDDRVPAVHAVHLRINGKTHRAGRFLVHDGELRHLEDYHGVLGRFIPEGPVTLQTVSRIHGLQMSPHLHIEREHPDPEPEEPKSAEQHVVTAAPAATKPKRPPVFEYRRVGMDKHHTLEVQDGVYLLDGNRLTHPEVSLLVENVRRGTGEIRYKNSGTVEKVRKMELALALILAKSDDDTDPGAALQAVRAAVAAGHLPSHVERALTRHIYEDKMTPGIGNKYAYDQFRQKEKPGVYVAMDGNSFKAINDAFGHEAGDSAIKAFGKVAREAMDEAVGQQSGKLFRSPQNLYRFGGDEFAAHVPSHEHAARFARLVHQKLANLPPIGGVHRLSMAFGFGPSHEHADAALFEAKKQKLHPTTGKKLYEPGQEPSFAHSLVPGFEGPLPIHNETSHVVQNVLTGPKLPVDGAPAEPTQPSSAGKSA